MILYTIELYKPDLILAVGYRVRSAWGVGFRRRASTVLKEYLEKGFAMNDERLKISAAATIGKCCSSASRRLAPHSVDQHGLRD